jgi:MFS family permease
MATVHVASPFSTGEGTRTIGRRRFGETVRVRVLRATFLLFGAFWGSWAVAALDVQRFLHFSDGQLGLLLAVTVLGGTAANAAGGVLAERHGTGPVMTTALVAWGALIACSAIAHDKTLFCICFVLTVGVGGLVDVTMNVAGTAALGSEPGRLLRLHALYNGGTLVGAGVMGLVLGAGHSFRPTWLAISVFAFAAAAWCTVSELPAGEAGEHHTVTEGVRALAREKLLPLASAFALGALVEGGVGTWGVKFLRSGLGVAALAGAGAYVVGQLLATITRATLGSTADRLGQRRGAQLGLGVAGIGLLLEASSTHPVPAAIGLALAAVGSAVYWPLLLAYASMGSERPGVVVGGLSAAGYAGFLFGPPVVGWVSQATNLRWGISALALAALGAAVIPIRRRTAVPA